MKLFRVAATIAALACTPFALAELSSAVPVSGAHKAMGTEFSITIYSRDDESNPALAMILLDELFDEIDRIEALISTWQADSQLSYINRHAAESPVRVTSEVLRLLLASESAFKDTDGAFDPTVGPLSRLYGLYDPQKRLPRPDEISATLERVGMDHVRIDPGQSTVSFDRSGVEFDSGGIGKGFAVDRVVEMLKSRGFTRAIVNGGTSTIYALGAPPDKHGWTVRVRDPYNPNDALAEVVLRDESLSTSGCYDLDVVDGVQICNIFDPRTGQPRRGMLSATVIAPSATATDALSTGFLVMGMNEARKYCAVHSDVRALMVPESPENKPAPVRIGEWPSSTKHGSTR